MYIYFSVLSVFLCCFIYSISDQHGKLVYFRCSCPNRSVFSSVIQFPADQTVFLNDYAFFSCITDVSSTANWRLNGTYDDLPRKLQHDLVISNESTTHFQVFIAGAGEIAHHARPRSAGVGEICCLYAYCLAFRPVCYSSICKM